MDEPLGPPADAKMLAEIRKELEQWETETRIPAAEVLRALISAEYEMQLLKEETWARLLRSIGAEPAP